MIEREPFASWANDEPDLPGAGFERIMRTAILVGFGAVLSLEGWLVWRAWQVFLQP